MSMSPISVTLNSKDRDAVMDAVATIKAKLPFLVDLNADERKALPKMGDKSRKNRACKIARFLGRMPRPYKSCG